MSRSATPTISTALLGPQERIPREPLGSWAARLHDKLRDCLRRERGASALSERVGMIANNAALIAAYRGDREAAWRLCERQLWWQYRLSRRMGSPEIASRCVPPWVNLARLEALSGACEAALARLGPLGAHRAKGVLVLRPVRMDGVGCQFIQRGSGEEFARLLESIYVIDSLKALLQTRRWEQADAFVKGMRAEGRTRMALWGDEAAVVALCRMEDFEGALREARTALARPQTRAWHRVTFALRLAEVQACAGEMDAARAELVRLAGALLKLSAAARSQLQPLHVLVRVAAACTETGLEGEALALAGAALDGARAAGDEVAQIEALRLLAELDPVAWEGELEALETATGYRRYRRQGVPVVDGGEFQALRGELEAVIGS